VRAVAKPQEGMDILKFFIGVMTLLTLFVAGFAGFNWSKAEGLRAQVGAAQASYNEVKRIAADPTFKELVARDREMKGFDTASSENFGQFLATLGSRLGIDSARKSEGGGTPQGGYFKVSYRITMTKQPLAQIVDYFYRCQLEWPGLKVETLQVTAATTTRGAFEGWNVNALVSIFKPKE